MENQTARALCSLLLCLFFLAASPAAYSQQWSVAGTVTDEESLPLIGVNIMVKGTSTGTVTDLDGKYRLDVPDQNAVLVFSYTGYAPTEETINGRSTIDVSLTEGVVIGRPEVGVIGSQAGCKPDGRRCDWPARSGGDW